MERKEVKFIIPNDKSESRYVGFDFEGDSSTFAFPCKYQVNGEEKREAKRLISLIKKAKKEYLYGGLSNELMEFYSMLWLVVDFIDHGYYVERETITKAGTSGKINWKKTIKKNSVLFAQDRIVYKDLERNKSKTSDAQILTQIHKCVLGYSVSTIGFIFGVEKTEPSVFGLNDSDVSFMAYYLQKELSLTFSDYKKTLIKHMLSVLKCKQGKTKGNGFSISDTEFEYVFEYLVNSVFGTEETKTFNTHATYNIQGESKKASALRPDTIMKHQEEYYIIDSKYYNYGYTKNPKDLPPSSSVTKQIAYNAYNETKIPATCKSVFLLPYASEKALEYVGYAYAQKDDSSLGYKEKIAVCLVDLKTLVDIHLDSNETAKNDLQATLVNLVNENCFK